MKRRVGTAVSLIAVLSACGGNGGSTGANTGVGANVPPVTSAPAPAPTPPPGQTSSGTCSVRDRQDWAGGQIREFYLFPETLPSNFTPTQATVDDYIDFLTATARAQRKDRFFTYLTSIKEENAFFSSGSSAGYGVRLALDRQNRLFVSEAFEGTPALAAGIDRGTEIVGIGTTAGNIRLVSEIIASEGTAGLNAALGPEAAGTTRFFRLAGTGGAREVSVAKAEFELTPVSSRYGAKIIEDGGKRVGYLNLRTFISTADPALRTAFANFKSAGVTEVIVDFRYNGGGLVSTAELMGDLLGANRSTSDVFSFTAFRPEKASNNSTRFFAPKAESIAPTRIAFIGTGGTASASELVINSFVPYLRNRAALIGSNTFGKPVGQIARDRAICDDRLRVVAFATQNAERRGDYYSGLATTVEATCQAPDDLSRPLGDPQEASTKSALDFLAGRSCTPITATQSLRGSSFGEGQPTRVLLQPDRPSTLQREVPGAF